MTAYLLQQIQPICFAPPMNLGEYVSPYLAEAFSGQSPFNSRVFLLSSCDENLCFQ